MATNQKTITVVGATGNQGGSVSHAFLPLPAWHVRALTRSTSSPAATSLSSSGASVVPANLDDPSTLLSAFRGSHVIYATTDFFALTKYPNLAELLSTTYAGLSVPQACYAHDLQQSKNILDAAAAVLAEKDSVLETLVLSTSSHAKKWSGGKIRNLLHFDVKAEAVEYLRSEHKKLAAKTNYLQVGFYMSNLFFPFLGPAKTEDGKEIVFRWPCVEESTVLPATDPARDVGAFVKKLVEAEYGTVMLGVSEEITVGGLVELFGSVVGRKARLRSVSYEEGVKGIEGAVPGGWGVEFADNTMYYRDFSYTGGDPAVKKSWDLGFKKEELGTFREFLEKQDWSSML